jgi:hypothetical protein
VITTGHGADDGDGGAYKAGFTAPESSARHSGPKSSSCGPSSRLRDQRRKPPERGLSLEPTPGLEPGTPSLRVKEQRRCVSRSAAPCRTVEPGASTLSDGDKRRTTMSCARGVRVRIRLASASRFGCG